MIIRHMPMKSVKKSSYARLVRYLTHGQGKEERVGEIRISNCRSLDPVWAGLEVKATQDRNKRAQGDKSYHLLISFAPGESLTPDVLKTIEDRVVASIGLSEHQRISAIHHDTDNLHIHIAVNKIHPIHYTMVEPFQAYKKFSAVAQQLESEFSLIKTNHRCQKGRSENRADDMEHHSGIESLINWVKRHCLDELEKCHDWTSFHNTLTRFGLTLGLRGNGLILESDSGLGVKPSSISRNFSKKKLEERFGSFQPSTKKTRTKHYSYTPKPLHQGKKSQELYIEYQADRTREKQRIAEKLRVLRDKKTRLIRQAKTKGKLKRAAVKMTKDGRENKKLLYEFISKSLKEEMGKIMKQYRIEREHHLARSKGSTWADWLQRRALDGNEDALTLMRQRATKTNNHYSLSGRNNKNKLENSTSIDGITKEGTVIQKVNTCTIRDNGKEISISRGVSVEGLKEAVLLAKKQYGDCIAVNGSKLFQSTILMVAVRFQLDIRFDDLNLELQRQNLIKNNGGSNEQSRSSGIIHGTATGRGNEVTPARKPTGYSNTRGRSKRINSKSKPNFERIGQCPPPESKNRLRSLSELHVVQFARGGEVLLQSHVHDNLERKGTQSDHTVRRPIYGVKQEKGTNRIK
ncbi:MAG: Protein TraI [Legionella sp.]|uniref:TraI/MobA(P) family conjugative relaxase n=1 Tax=Legionella sp. TaxID=459 RepID=UPI003D1535EA